MARLLLNIDVPSLEAGIAFYTKAFGLRVARRFDAGFVELLADQVAVYLMEKKAGTSIGPTGEGRRCYDRHWTPIHPDIVVDDLDAAVRRVLAAGAVIEENIRDAPYGRLAMFSDPFGHGFCLIEFNDEGYDALLS